MMDKCEKVAEQASDYLDQNMSFSKRLKMRAHLMMCSHCRQFVRQFEITIGAIKCLGRSSSDNNKQISDEDIESQVKKLLKEHDRINDNKQD